MVVILVCAAGLVLAWPLATGSLPTSAGGGRRADAQRLRHVERHPRDVTTADVARLLRAHELPPEEIRFVLGKADQLGVGAFTLWMWIKRFDVHALAVVIGADIGHAELLRHLADGSLPDLAELEVFAVLNGLPRGRAAVTTHEERASEPTAMRVVRRAPGSGLRIEDPGTWPYAA
ncbi:hypothetical protein [Nocardioides abyssi]|jgi:hypothetical protein|uniref:Uncharacterized protein n=1 Tax=Nocardioides abyssi TaxID=3058370 RepID=A0ABT8EVF5_9ACTN|nr:hypothetical protein [Nocardioides abyssi]MDN4162165.1 hypothetical protein [Nocardioides abyssi]